MDYFSIYAAFAVLLITLLAMNISRTRFREKIGNGDGGNAALKKAIRAHMNALEHMLPFAVILLACEKVQLDSLYVAVLSMTFLLVRVVHAYSMLWSRFRLRQISASLTYLLELTACLLVIVKVF